MPEQEQDQGQKQGALRRIFQLIPGILLCGVVTVISLGVQAAEERVFDHPYIEALVVAILLGMAVRTAWEPSARWRSGIAFSAKQLLEVAVMLLGASISFAAIVASGGLLIGAIAVTVVIMLAVSYGLSRMLGLKTKLAILIACGNSICGNSAIAAVAPVIEADGDDIASSISFTAILGVLMVLGLPLLIPLLKLTATQYGILAGLTVYAVPQVLAATVPAGIVSTQIGTLVKLVRVLMLGPIVIGLSLLVARRRKAGAAREGTSKAASISPFKLVPWFIIGFLVLAALRSFQLVPDIAIAPVTKTAAILTVVSMAALGLGVDVRVLSTVGGRVTAAVTLSLMLLLALSIGLVHFFK
ncbi:YeiH family protein [Bradyrhizobium elkanii]|uniref:YeiH family protein n=1 Tax=Bradyrhizobium elkanii TaxID=29448 RepID=UPI0020A1DBB3|nr:putative sulfate exporter family transporter [Bradyrhizobium elkanii]MCP1971549.1 putative integral membrane protein (TIGR00698 family) [Bradyrhizobium elkanii]MCS3518705.1 putative integral membrane protein (TIGR00698 family) [Bradyrhizobium elkanii]MCS4075263.1 putative integral membrane protein (TIGR00698 family) [Bradyrhizobium elkanii]MCS4081896.1 putative integral membrane protein (TIGR00698 family) [Bradyrhizobium elkanii]MCS4106945.1 putative integral membrane protein (TIGR00698 fam